MQKIGLVDVDGHHFPNLALMKLSAWHKSQGDMVEFADPMFGHYDRVYMSKVFTFTPDCPDYYPCEVVAVAQRYQDIFNYSNCVNPYAWEDDDKPSGWTNKMLTKAELMPHQIRITGIKCERLQDISEEDCMKEGILGDVEYDKYEVYGLFGNSDDGFDTPREAFASLIDKVSGRGTWKRNPWVVAYEFELVK